MTSCEDYLEADNKSAGGNSMESYFGQESNLGGYRDYAYMLLKPLVNGGYIEMMENGTDIYWHGNNKKNSTFDKYTITVGDKTVEGFYSKCYLMINAANGLLEFGSTYASDAKFLRAYGYYLLTQQFGKVPYVKRFINDSSRDYPRESLQTIYDSCLADLDEVIADGNLAESSQDGYVNKRAARALAAKIALAAGWDLETTLNNAEAGTYTVGGNTYFTRAAQYAEQAVEGMQMYDSFADKWSVANERSNQETIFALTYDRSAASNIGDEAEGGHSLANYYGRYYGSGPNICGVKYVDGSFCKSLKSLYLWEAGDERYDATFQNTIYGYQDGVWPSTGYYAYLNNSEETLATMGLWYYYSDESKMTSEEFKALVDTMAASGKFAQGDNKLPAHAIYLGTECEIYDFNAAGTSYNTTSQDYATTIEATAGGQDPVRKWDDGNALMSQTSQNSYRWIPLFHMTETMLTAAEAYYMAGNESKALEIVNQIRTRAKATTLTSFADYAPQYATDLYPSFEIRGIDVILDEKARETYAEQNRWTDLRRTKQLFRYKTTFVQDGVSLEIVDNYGNYKWYRPIPSTELSSNMSMSEADQNPGY